MKKNLLIIGLILSIVAVIGVLIRTNRSQITSDPFLEQATNTPQPEKTESARIPRDIPKGSKEYANEQYGFSLVYPESLQVHEEQDGGGTVTVVFQNDEPVEGFQIFITPYSGAQVSEERFRIDIPSGVRTNLENITIDGALGAAFYSMDQNLGETREVWFVQGRYLYEVTTLRSLEASLHEVMKSWMFI